MCLRWHSAPFSRSGWTWTAQQTRPSLGGSWCPGECSWSCAERPGCCLWRCRAEGWPRRTGWRTAASTPYTTTTHPKSATSGRDSTWLEVSHVHKHIHTVTYAVCPQKSDFSTSDFFWLWNSEQNATACRNVPLGTWTFLMNRPFTSTVQAFKFESCERNPQHKREQVLSCSVFHLGNPEFVNLGLIGS